MTKLLIDGDVIAYRAAFAAEKTKYLVQAPDGSGSENFFPQEDSKGAKELAAHYATSSIWSRKDVQPVEQATLIADVMIRDIRDRYASEKPEITVFLSGIGNFRNAFATRATYKGNRSGSVPPVHHTAVRNHLVERGAVVSQFEEADDLMGIAATENPSAIVCSIDKDLLQLPGRHYNFVTKEEQTVSKKAAVLNFYTQVIAGDSVDNVPGMPGYGQIKARKALEGARNPVECWGRALELYQGEFGSAGYAFALETAQLVHVRRRPYELWRPPEALPEVSTGMSAVPATGPSTGDRIAA